MCRRIRVQQFDVDCNLPLCRYCAACVLHRLDHTVASLKIDIADVSGETNPARNAIDRARKHLADAHGRHGINRATASRRILNRQDQCGGRTKGVPSIRHQDSTSVSARAFDCNPHAGGSGNARDHPERYLLVFQHRTLLNMQLDERLVIVVRQLHFVEFAAQAYVAANVLYGFFGAILQPLSVWGGKASAEQPAAEAPYSKACRLL